MLDAKSLLFVIDCVGVYLAYRVLIEHETWREASMAAGLLATFAFVAVGDLWAITGSDIAIFREPIRPFIFRPLLILGLAACFKERRKYGH